MLEIVKYSLAISDSYLHKDSFINLIPFPAFDGGRILFLVIEKIKGSPVNPKVENIFHSIGFILLLLLLVVITFNDIVRMFFS